MLALCTPHLPALEIKQHFRDRQPFGFLRQDASSQPLALEYTWRCWEFDLLEGVLALPSRPTPQFSFSCSRRIYFLYTRLLNESLIPPRASDLRPSHNPMCCFAKLSSLRVDRLGSNHSSSIYLLSLCFYNDKMGMNVILPTSWGCCED